MLAGSRELIDEAWRWKQMMGGAMRQAGIVAAGCLYALDHHVERLAEDHENARVLADGLAELGLEVIAPETNIVIFAAPAGFVERWPSAGSSCRASGRAHPRRHPPGCRPRAVDRALEAARVSLLA